MDGTVTWRCTATADPEATVTWQNDGIDIVESDAISVSRDGDELTVLNLRPEDAGRYTCIAFNYVGSVSASARLLVIGISEYVVVWCMFTICSFVDSPSFNYEYRDTSGRIGRKHHVFALQFTRNSRSRHNVVPRKHACQWIGFVQVFDSC